MILKNPCNNSDIFQSCFLPLIIFLFLSCYKTYFLRTICSKLLEIRKRIKKAIKTFHSIVSSFRNKCLCSAINYLPILSLSPPLIPLSCLSGSFMSDKYNDHFHFFLTSHVDNQILHPPSDASPPGADPLWYV